MALDELEWSTLRDLVDDLAEDSRGRLNGVKALQMEAALKVQPVWPRLLDSNGNDVVFPVMLSYVAEPPPGDTSPGYKFGESVFG